MKKYIYILCAVLTAAFASCSQSEMGDETLQSKQTILKVVASDGLQTRGTATGVDRFAIEVYTDEAYTTAANVFADGTNKANNGNGEFAMVLDRTQKYYCLLWADKAGSSVYNINDLKAVALTGKAVEAWQGTKEIAAGTEAALTATLNRAVSKISLMETGKLKAGTLTLNLNQPTVFNVATAVTTGEATARPEESITIAADKDGSVTPVKLNTTDIFVLSSVATANLTDLTFKYGTEDAFIVPQAPLKANYNTNIKGHYSKAKDGVTFTVTCDDAWGTPDNDKVTTKPIEGEFYYKDGTHSVDYKGTTENPCIGVVIDVEKGLILSDVLSRMSWATAAGADVLTNTTNADGREDVKVLKGISADLSQYPAARTCDNYSVGGTGWYLPSETEVTMLTGGGANQTKWKNIFTAAQFTGTGTAFADGFWTITVDESVPQVWVMNWTHFAGGLKYESESQYYYNVRCVKRVAL